MNVLLVDQYSELGGAQRCLLDLLPAMRQAGWEITVAAPGGGELLDRANSEGATTARITCGPYSFGYKTVGDLRRFVADQPELIAEFETLIRTARADLIYVNGPRLIVAAALASRGRTPVLFHCHHRLGGPVAAAVSRALRVAKATVAACCRYVTPPISRYLPPESVNVVYNGVAANPLAQLSSRFQRPWRIGMIGRIAPQKGQAELLKAARMLSASRDDVEYVICGEPLFGDQDARVYGDQLRTLAKGLPVRFLGWRQDVPALLSQMDLVVVPSMGREATTRVILEAFAARVPVLGYKTGGIPEMVESGRTGILVEPRPEALAGAMGRLLSDEPATLQELAENALAEWRARFTLGRYQQNILELARAAARVKAA